MNNEQFFEQAQVYIPGGVHSPVRSFKGLDLCPRFIKQSQGAYITDEEGTEFIDFCMSFGPLILGHKHPKVQSAIIEAVNRGWTYGACEKYSLDLAKFIVDRISFIDKIRFVSSGTEAVMTSLRLARGFTKKSKVIKFNGCYHGHVDSMLIKSGSGLAGTSTASSLGVTENCAKDTLVVDLGDMEALEKCFQDHDDIAAIIVEPLPANYGLLVQTNDFLKQLKEITKKHGALLIFDEVISGFRVAFGGMAEKTGIEPDIVTYGKVIGGGMPVGAIAARSEIMDHLAPLGGVYQAGTLSANPVAMCAGLANLEILAQDNFYSNLEAQTHKIVNIFKQWLDANTQHSIITHSSLFWIVSTDQKISNVDRIPHNLGEKFNKLSNLLIPKGIYLSPNAYEVGFVSQAHTDEVIEDFKKRLWS